MEPTRVPSMARNTRRYIDVYVLYTYTLSQAAWFQINDNPPVRNTKQMQ